MPMTVLDLGGGGGYRIRGEWPRWQGRINRGWERSAWNLVKLGRVFIGMVLEKGDNVTGGGEG